LAKMSLDWAVQMEGFGSLLCWRSYFPRAAISSGRLCKPPLRTRVTVRSRKKRSAMLSHEALVGVKWGWNRGGA
jgi:hypothetical protein